MRWTEEGSERRREGIFSVMSANVAPGKGRVMALKKRIPLIMESPMMAVVGGKSGACGGPVGALSEEY